MSFVKVCGIQTREEADAALDCGATAVGFLIGLTHRAADEIGETEARAVVARLPAGAEAVLVTHLLDPARVAELAASVGAHAIQVHGNMALADLRRLRALAPGKRLVKAVHVTGEDALGRALGFAADAGALLLGTRTADRLGGTGRTHDWSVSARIVAAVAPLPVYLAGGAAAGERRTGHRAGAPGRGGRELRLGGRGRAQGRSEDAGLRGPRH